MPIDAALAAVFGLVVGSFLNVCIYRLPRDFSVSYPRRSFCPNCGRKIPWYENVPVLSYLLLLGQCRGCKFHIPVRYPLVEILTAAAFYFAVYVYGFSGAAISLAIFCSLLIVLLFTDLETRILPDEITLGGAFAGWILAILVPLPPSFVSLLLPSARTPAGESLVSSLAGGLLPALGLWLIGELYFRLRHREGLGFGDIKMILMIGAFLGLENTVLTIIIGSVAGSLIGIAALLIKGREAAKYELPFGTFLAAAGLVVACLYWRTPLY